jgi:hypothetical protein
MIEEMNDFWPEFAFIGFVPTICSMRCKARAFAQGIWHSHRMQVHRDCLYESSRSGLLSFDQSRVNGKMTKVNIRFDGESGIDTGGLAMEWCGLLSSEFETNHRMLAPTPNRDTFTLKKSGRETSDFVFLGRFIAACIQASYPFALPLSTVLLKQILGQPVTLEDLDAYDSQLYESLKWVMENSVADVGLRFVHKKASLVPGGQSIAVTDANKHDYVQKKLEWIFVRKVENELRDFRAGLYGFVNLPHLQLFSVDDLRTILSVQKDIYVADWKGATKVCGPWGREALNRFRDRFFAILEGWSQVDLKRLLKFTTGIQHLPVDGFASFKNAQFTIRVTRKGDGTYPEGHTCSRALELPDYSTPEIMEQKLREAILIDEFQRS